MFKTINYYYNYYLGALEAVVVAGLHGTAEESATRRTNLIQSVGGVYVESEMNSFF